MPESGMVPPVGSSARDWTFPESQVSSLISEVPAAANSS
jgi:hypothetical protein